MKSFVGVWNLSSWLAEWGCEFEGTVSDFLDQDPATPLLQPHEAGEVGGSTLTIESSGEFSQAGRSHAPVVTYDSGGIQVPGVAEFDGVIRERSGRCYLICRPLSARVIHADSATQPCLRWDDGDTKVCDSIRLINGRLVRTICVVTDECYGDRVFLLYDRGAQ